MSSNKQRFIEVFEKVNKIKINESLLLKDEKESIINESLLLKDEKESIINESLLLKDEKESIINDFVNYVLNELNLDTKPEIIISYDESEASTNKSFGGYMPFNKSIRIVLSNRNLADVLRTLGHELKHYEQDLKGVLDSNSGETGSDCENEANAFAGIVMRNYGKINPNIFE